MPFLWTDRDLRAFERLKRIVGDEVIKLGIRSNERVIQASQYVGVIRLGNQTIQILPKMYRSDDGRDKAEHARVATKNLLYLLSIANHLQVREHSVAQFMKQDSDWFEILTHIFATHLMDEWQRGPCQGYQVINDELPVLKGKWRISEQLRRPERKHIFSVSYDEFTPDTALNRIFRYVVERLFSITQDSNNKYHLGILRQWMEDVILLPAVNASDVSLSLITRLNQRFEPLLNLAIMFLSNEALQITTGDRNTYAFVFDMNKLFESFIYSFINRYRNQILPESLIDCQLLPQARGKTHHLAVRESTHSKVFPLFPDIAFQDNGGFPMLVDTKYKGLDATSRRMGISPDDFYQMFAYAHRYNSPRVLLLYPQTADMIEPLQARFHLEGTDSVVEASTVDLRISLVNQQGRESLINEFSHILRSERFNETYDSKPVMAG